MPNTYIDTNKIPHIKTSGSGEYAEILNNELAGANNVVATLRWLHAQEHLDLGPEEGHHQLIYLMEGDGVINLDGKSHAVSKGNGMYLGPNETARISHAGGRTLKLFHLVVPKQS